MSEKESIFDGLPHIDALQLKNKRVTLTISSVTGGVKFVSEDGRTAMGFDVSFKETTKKLGITGVTVRRQLTIATGTDNPAEMVDKRITLYPIESKKSSSGKAIRIAKAD